MQKSLKSNLLRIFALVLTVAISYGVTNFMPKNKALAKELTGLSVYNYATVKADENGDKSLTFKTKIGSEFLSNANSSEYTFGTIIYPTLNGEIDISKKPSENTSALDGINFIKVKNQSVVDSFEYTSSILFDKQTIQNWAIMQDIALNSDSALIENALAKIYENLYAKSFTAVSYAITDNGTFYSNAVSTSVLETEELEYSTEGIEYEIVNNEYAKVTAYNGTAGDVVIPCAYNHYPVKEIGGRAFASSEILTSIVISENITNIGVSAFYNCAKLTKINFNATKCEDLGSGIFGSAGDRDGIDLIVASNVERIPANLFNASSGTPRFSKVIFEQNPSCKLIGSCAFNGNFVDYFNYNGTLEQYLSMQFDCSITACSKNLYLNGVLVTKLVIPEVTKIPANAFDFCKSLTSISVPGTVIEIGNGAFEYCENITSVTLSEGLKTINSFAFDGCNFDFTQIKMPKTLDRIGNHAFDSRVNCSGTWYKVNNYNDWVNKTNGTKVDNMKYVTFNTNYWYYKL